MIILDTNVLSDTLRPAPSATVLEWLASKPAAALFTTTITRGEILYGVRLLPKGRRRDALWHAVQAIFDEDFARRILSFDSHAADAYADIAAARKTAGQAISQLDAMIAATARSRGAALATRNIKDFSACGIELVNPWGKQ
ncbi:MAG: type II toxin-antitoxin system VapC family toxin [Rhodanobacteraceae bacterium]